MMDGFVKLYGTILTSSIWLEDDATLRVWITMLATADWNGYVGASVGGLAHVARVSREACVKALATFEAPDPDSRTPDDDGRRIKKVDGGWIVLNIKKYRDMRSDEQVKEAQRKANWRASKKQTGQGGTVPDVPVTSEQMLDVDGDGDKDLTTPPHPAREGQAGTVPKPYDELLAILGDEHLPWLLGKIEASGMAGHAWVAEIRALLDGMHGAKVPVEVRQRAVQDYIAAMPKQPSLKHFRAFVRSATRESDPQAGEKFTENSFTLRAGEIIDLIQQYKPPPPPPRPEPKLKPTGPLGRMQPVEGDTPPPLPTSPAWRDKLSQGEVRAVNAVGVQRIVTTPDDKRGILLAQLAKALAEAGA